MLAEKLENSKLEKLPSKSRKFLARKNDIIFIHNSNLNQKTVVDTEISLSNILLFKVSFSAIIYIYI